MRRIFPSVSAASARAVLVSAALLAGASFFPAQAHRSGFVSPLPSPVGDETAFAEVRPSLGEGEVTFPRPLSALATVRYRSIFHFLREGDLQAAKVNTALVQDRVLLSDVLAERYLRSESHPGVEELRDWLKAYPQSPDVPAIQNLLIKLQPSLAGALPRNTVQILRRGEVASLPSGASITPLAQAFSRNVTLEHTVQERASHGLAGANSALHLIDTTPGVNVAYAAQLYGEVALSLLSQGDAREALRIGSQGFHLGNQKVGFPAFVAGLAAWHEGRVEAAYLSFEVAANAVTTDGDIQAAAAFWAARIKVRHHQLREYYLWLHRAAIHNSSFYGLLAAHLLQHGKEGEACLSQMVSSPDAMRLELGEVDIEAVMSMSEGRHLFALLQIGEQGRAEVLMRRMWPDVVVDPVRARSLQLVARYAGMTELAGQMGDVLDQLGHQNLKTGLPPLPHLNPQNGFHFDPALVYAVVYTESKFNPEAVSPVGALGMMQIRPSTVSFLNTRHVSSGEHKVVVGHNLADVQRRLYDPGYNLEVGQLYMLYLADAVSKAGGADTRQGGDLLRILASYNAGPQAIVNWENLQRDQHDPLYFVETLPNSETRNYVHRVMTMTWLYARRMGLASPSLSTLSEARWPSFKQEESIRETPS